jgi:cell wall-associated NlpC family hydrolase
MNQLDKRLHAWRSDLADAKLRGRVEAEFFVEGRAMQVTAAVASVRKAPAMDAVQTSEALMGERIFVFEVTDGWAFCQLERDNYVGYVRTGALTDQLTELTHRVAVPATFLYPAANLKSQPATGIPMNSRLAIVGGDERFAETADGRFVIASHLKHVDEFETDFVTVAEMFRHVPYYWGGKTVRGIDCSGLVQTSLEACGIPCPRDSDMQERALGTRLMVNDLDGLKRGDLMFWDGHAGIMTGETTLLHANGLHMLTVEEPLREAVNRIAATGKPVTSIKRL